MQAQLNIASRIHRVAFLKVLRVEEAGQPTVSCRAKSAADKLVLRNVKTVARKMPIEEGPYADRKGSVKAIAGRIAEAANGNFDLELAAVLELVTPQNADVGLGHEHMGFRKMVMNEGALRQHPVLMTAGEVACLEPEEVAPGIRAVQITNATELYILAVSVLRELGHNAYFGYMSGVPTNEEAPVLPAIHIIREDELIVFDITRMQILNRPPILADVMADEGVYSYLHMQLAAAMAQNLGYELVAGINSNMQAAGLGRLMEQMLSGFGIEEVRRPLHPFDLLDERVLQVLEHPSGFFIKRGKYGIITREQSDAFTREQRQWAEENHDGIVDRLHAIAKTIDEGVKHFADAHFWPELLANILPGILPPQFLMAITQQLGDVNHSGLKP